MGCDTLGYVLDGTMDDAILLLSRWTQAQDKARVARFKFSPLASFETKLSFMQLSFTWGGTARIGIKDGEERLMSVWAGVDQWQDSRRQRFSVSLSDTGYSNEIIQDFLAFVEKHAPGKEIYYHANDCIDDPVPFPTGAVT